MIGKVIKVLAVIWFFIVAIGFMYGVAMLWNSNPSEDASVFILIGGIGGTLTTIVSTLLLYGYGDLIDTNRQILEKLEKK